MIENSLLFLLFAILIYIAYVIVNNITSEKDTDENDNSTPNSIGEAGERSVASVLSMLPSSDYVVLNNLTLLYNNSTHQIDHVVVSNYGIFIIETKNYSGLIKGSDKYKYWLQFIGRKKYKFLNPVIQNEGHLKALNYYFNEYKDFFVPIVCFTNKSKLKIDSRHVVIQQSMLLRYIYNYKTEVLIPDINEVAQNLKNYSLSLIGVKQDHINNVNSIMNKNRKG